MRAVSLYSEFNLFWPVFHMFFNRFQFTLFFTGFFHGFDPVKRSLFTGFEI